MNEDKSDALREARKQYYKNWRAKNPDKVAAIQARFWQRKLEEQTKQVENAIPKEAEIR